MIYKTKTLIVLPKHVSYEIRQASVIDVLRNSMWFYENADVNLVDKIDEMYILLADRSIVAVADTFEELKMLADLDFPARA